MKHIAQSLVKAQKEFGPALKTSTNPHFKSRYADLSNCIEAVIDALNNNGIALIQQTHEDQSGVTVETMFLHESGESLTSGKLHVPASKNDPQGYGSALTYARRYSLMAACGIAPEDDDGNAASRKVQTLNDQQCAEIANLIDETGSDFVAFMGWVSKAVGTPCKTLNQVPAEAYQPIVSKLKKKVATV
jgi:hypothetical protein